MRGRHALSRRRSVADFLAPESTTDDLARYWDTATSFIVEAKREGCVVLVYDFSGVSRGPTFVLAYLMMEEKLLFREGLFILKVATRAVVAAAGI